MTTLKSDKNLDFYSPASFQIVVKGKADKNISDLFDSLKISFIDRDNISVSMLEGEVLDQAALIGIINALYDIRLPLISVKIKPLKSIE